MGHTSGMDDGHQIWGYDDAGDPGRLAYTHAMAVEFLRNRDLPLPEELMELKVASIRAWLLAIATLDPPAEDASATRYLGSDHLPPVVDLDDEDLRILASLDQWPAVPRARRELLILRMAVDHVRCDYGGAVPEGLVTRTMRAAAAA